MRVAEQLVQQQPGMTIDLAGGVEAGTGVVEIDMVSSVEARVSSRRRSAATPLGSKSGYWRRNSASASPTTGRSVILIDMSDRSLLPEATLSSNVAFQAQSALPLLARR